MSYVISMCMYVIDPSRCIWSILRCRETLRHIQYMPATFFSPQGPPMTKKINKWFCKMTPAESLRCRSKQLIWKYDNKMSPLDWYILVGLVIMLPRSFLQEPCVPAIQRISDNSLNVASQHDQEYSIGCDSCHCDLWRCFAMYICLGVTSMMYYIKTLRDLQKGKVSIFPDCKCSACVGTPVFEKVWVLATLAVF